MQNDRRQSIIDDLNKYTVAIKDSETGETHGTGVIVTAEGLILTCYHVIGDNESESFYYKDSIGVYFPEANVIKAAYVEEKYSNPELDFAFLRLQEGEKLPKQTAVAPLGESVWYKHEFASIGFRKAQQVKKLSTDGNIRIKTSLMDEEEEEEGKVMSPLIQLNSGEIEDGMSGAAVLDVDSGRVVGIISLHHPAVGSTVDTRLNFAIPVESILKLSTIESILRNENPGLKKINQFMEKIGLGKSKLYQRFDDVYVPPIEYAEIEKTLKDHRCVFIIGSPEYGKTYTAIKLL